MVQARLGWLIATYLLATFGSAIFGGAIGAVVGDGMNRWRYSKQ